MYKVKKGKKVIPLIIISHSINFNMSTYEFVENDKKIFININNKIIFF